MKLSDFQKPSRILVEKRINFAPSVYLLLFLRGPSAYASGSTSALWLIVLSPYYTFKLSPPVQRCHALQAEKAGVVTL
jgi:hypothetical protein